MTDITHADHSPAPLVLTTLGGLSVQVGQQPVSSLFQTKLGALFAYIVFKSLEQPDAPVPRAELAELFWPQAETSAARTNLRQALRQLKNALGKEQAKSLVTSTQAVSWQLNQQMLVDFERVEQTARNFDLLIEQLSLYNGHFLAEIPQAHESTALGKWIRQTQTRLWHRLLSASASWLQRPLDRNQRERLKPLLERLQSLAPTEQSLIIQRAQLKVQSGDKHAAIAFCHQKRDELSERNPKLDLDELERFTNRLKASLPQPEPHLANSALQLKSERRDVALVVCVIEPLPQQEVEQQTATMQEAMAYLDAVFVTRRAHSLPLPGGGMLGYFGYPSATENPLTQALDLACEASFGIKQPVNIQTYVDADLIITGTDTDWPDPAGVLTRRAINKALAMPPKQVGVNEAIVKRCHQTLQGQYVSGQFVLEQAPGWFEQRPTQEDTLPLIGRDNEFTRLKQGVINSLQKAVEFMLVKGEPGLGKSHLIQSLINDPEISNHCQIALIHCREQDRGVRLGPLLNSQSQRNQWLIGDHNPQPHRDQANRLIDLWVDRVLAQTRQNPVLLVVEDLHWADSATLEWIRRLQIDTQQHNLAMVAATRNEFQLPFAISRNQTIELDRLDFTQTLNLANVLNKPDKQSPWIPILSDQRLNSLAAQSDGVPLFLQELIHHAQEQQSISTMPPNLADFLIARLDTLGKHSGLAQIAATIGRDFDAQTLTQITQLRAADLQPSLDALVEKGFIKRNLKKGSISYRFRHALLQKAAYESQLRSKREQLHANIAEVLFKRSQQESEQIEPQLLAWHLSQSGQHNKAIQYWLKAGKKALAEGMQPESVEYFQHAATQLENSDDEKIYNDLLAEAVLGLGTAKLAVDGYGSAEVFRLFEQARGLIAPQKNPYSHFQCLWGLWHGASSWLGAEDTHKLADELTYCAEQLDSRIARIAAHYVQGNSHFWRAHYTTALEHQQAALNLAQPGDDDALIAWLGENPIVFAQSFAAWTHWFTGDTKSALNTIRQAERRANGIEHSSSLGFVYIFSAVLGFYQADVAHTRKAASHAMEIARYYNFPLWQIAARTLLNWADAREDNQTAARAIFEQITAMQQVMSGISCIFQTILLDALAHTPSMHEHVEQAYNLALHMATDCRDACFLPLIHLIKAQYHERIDQPEIKTQQLSIAQKEAQRQKATGIQKLIEYSAG